MGIACLALSLAVRARIVSPVLWRGLGQLPARLVALENTKAVRISAACVLQARSVQTKLALVARTARRIRGRRLEPPFAISTPHWWQCAAGSVTQCARGLCRFVPVCATVCLHVRNVCECVYLCVLVCAVVRCFVAGQYFDGSSCVDCAAGTFSEAFASECTDCQPGTYSGAGASQCSSCECLQLHVQEQVECK